MREMVGGCCVCSDDRGWSENPLVYCDGQSCTVAVHQACYGIVTVPTGPWYCRKCESQERSVKVKCELCPSKYGALKRTDTSAWAHVVCALYIPEVRFGNVTTMEPIQLQLIPAERFNKVCYICEGKKSSNATIGACMQCNKVGCKQQFHVTCAQGLGLLCEEAGNYLDNVKYCGYCQHHYSKLKKGGNVKTIPPYKPVANEAHNSDSNSEKEPEGGPSNSKTGVSPPSSGKRKAIQSSNKAPASKNAGKNSSQQQQQQQKSVHNNKTSEKTKATVKISKLDETILESGENKKDTESEQKETKDNKVSKKRKANSRTPTPVSGTPSEVSVVTTVTSIVTPTSTSTINDKKSAISDIIDKTKKVKVDTTQLILTNQPVVALTSISPIKTTSPATAIETITSSEPTVSAPPIIQTTQVPSQSLVVSVPLANTTLSPHKSILNNQTTTVVPPVVEERSSSIGSTERSTPVIINNMIGSSSNQDILTSDMNSGGLKITYEKQVDSINTEVDMELDLEPTPSTNVEVPAKRGRSQSQSNEKTDRASRSRKRNSTGGSNSTPAALLTSNTTLPKRSSRSTHVTPPPSTDSPGAFSSIVPPQIKDSPPSSPSSESQSVPPISRRTRARKSDSSIIGTGSGSSKDSKDVKIFQNGLSAPHMLGNQLNPNSTMHSKMNDHLNNELEAHSIFNPNESNSSLVGPQLHQRVLQSARASSTGSSTASGGSGLSSMLSGGGGNIPQTLDQLLERQWEQGSQFLMEQAQHFDIASLLSCLHQLRAENLRLEEHVSSLIQRRDHLLAVNARLAIPLTNQPPAAPLSTHSHSVNNIHPSVAAVHGEVPRSSRHGGGYPSHPQSSAQHPMENGLPPDTYPPSSHRTRSPNNHGSQPSPNVRHSPAGAYTNSSLQRQNADGRSVSALRPPQPYLLYDRAGGPSPQQQMVIRRDRGDRESDMLQHASKPS
ncbi:protein AF-10 isoform X1 [Diorhabda sublineata]|uniref:protein AF-10 isoform X1 n=1 Tax=Diorhabda sublineata TaxID=1163346 RepID=UPI0024E1667E|nr:protein AF-10 isoform X1 [Diorhabda sublineata]XP_056647034.1 protein AF-10 isoform X1 [Diorhabda sublineata]